MEVRAIESQKFLGGENLFQSFLDTDSQIKNGDILVISSKIVAISQNRIVRLSDYDTDPQKAREEIIKEEADKFYPGKYILALKDNMLTAFAGIDESNIPNGQVVLWPKNSYEVCRGLHQQLCEHFNISDLGIIISDSRCTPLRWGVIGLALAWYGFKGLEDLRGQKDLFGRTMELSQKAVADNLASAAMVVQGEGAECTPFAIISNAPADFSEPDNFEKVPAIAPEDDLFSGVMNL